MGLATLVQTCRGELQLHMPSALGALRGERCVHRGVVCVGAEIGICLVGGGEAAFCRARVGITDRVGAVMSIWAAVRGGRGTCGPLPGVRVV